MVCDVCVCGKTFTSHKRKQQNTLLTRIHIRTFKSKEAQIDICANKQQHHFIKQQIYYEEEIITITICSPCHASCI